MKNFINNVAIPFICCILIVLCLLGIFTQAFSQRQQTAIENEIKIYGRIARVVELDYEGDIVVVEDELGYLWEFYGVED